MSIFPQPSQTRLVTIIAQVDHGKTTLADSLIESNGIISERLAGTLRYLDDLQEEQRRGITIRTSAIGLQHDYQKTKSGEPLKMVIHVLDSPGHADFCTEVSSALQCCDGALLVVDAVEGLCARTHQVLREAFVNQLIPILVINKVDRLCTELCLTEEEAYLRLRKLLESMNAASSAMITSSRAADNDDDVNVNNNEQEEEQEEDNDDDQIIWNFDPTRGNVVFCSAIHGWGFTVPALARDLFRSKEIEGIKPPILKQYLFGDYKYRDGKVLKWKPDTDELPMFAEYGLKPIWQVYQGISQAAISCGLGSNLFGNAAATSTTGAVKITATTAGMDLVQEVLGSDDKVSVSDILQQTGSSTEDAVLRAVLRRYRPLSTNVLNAVCDKCPSPAEASASVRTRALALQPGGTNKDVKEAVRTCSTDPSSPTVAHVCKFLTTDRSNVRGIPDDSDSGDSIVLMGVARVLSGVLTSNETYSCLGPKHGIDGTITEQPPPPQRTIQLYLLMGSSLVPVDQVPAGHLCAVYGLEDLQLQTVTLSSQPDCMPLQGFNHGVRPLVKVNVEPVHAEDAAALERGLVKLTLADAAVEVTATSKGERIVACLGEIHLEQSLLDLKTTYAPRSNNGEELKLRISKPIVEFGETTDWFEEDEATDYSGFFATTNKKVPPLRHTTIPPYNEEEGIRQARRGRTRAYLSGKSVAIGVRVVPLDPSVYQAFQSKTLPEDSSSSSSSAREEVLKFAKALGCDDDDDVDATFASMLTTLRSMGANGNILLESRGISSGPCVKGVIGEQVYYVMEDNNNGAEEDEQDESDKDQQQKPQEPDAGLEEYQQLQETVRQGGLLPDKEDSEVSAADQAALDLWKSQMSGSIVAGFQLGLRAGPICEEPVHQVCVILESVEVALSPSLKPSKPLSGGMVIGALKQGIRSALLSRPARLMEGHLKLTLHSSLNALGSLYAVLSKRRGKVLHDDMVEGTDLLLITATLPQAESYGLAPELLRKTSGQVTVPELTFYAVSRLEENPFWIPQSLEEREDFGEILTSGDTSTGVDNTALTYIRQVRERKGLLVDSNRTVVAAEKQRTMKR